MEALIDLLDDAKDEILSAKYADSPLIYSESECAAFLECYRHWLTTGLSEADLAFLRAQLHEGTKEEEDA